MNNLYDEIREQSSKSFVSRQKTELDDVNRKISGNNILFHWTNDTGIERILDSGHLEAGSLTTNPQYRFGEGGVSSKLWKVEERFGLLFDRTKIDKKFVEEVPEKQYAPFPEWEVRTSVDLPLMSDNFVEAKSSFIGFVARNLQDAKKIQRLIVRNFEDEEMKDFYDIFLLRGRTLRRYNNHGG